MSQKDYVVCRCTEIQEWDSMKAQRWWNMRCIVEVRRQKLGVKKEGEREVVAAEYEGKDVSRSPRAGSIPSPPQQRCRYLSTTFRLHC